jgi:uncharacterized protein (TIGR03437 family)
MNCNGTDTYSRVRLGWSASDKTTAFLCTMLAMLFLSYAQLAYAQSTPIATGYRDFQFGSNVIDTPTGEKPQSKLWFNDDSWWGSLWDPSLNKYAIHKFSVATQSWTSTSMEIDDRGGSKADALWDGTKLYVVSHVFTTLGGSASAGQEARLYRYSYNASTDTYTLDAGFPVNVNDSISETLVLDKDSAGQLWITWTENGKVKINRSTTDDATWGAPFDLPVQGNDIDVDDISSLAAFGGNKIGVMWSNRDDQKTYFAVHQDSDADNVWQAIEPALEDATLGAVSDDHVNLKMSADGSGNLFAVVKTRLAQPESPHIYLLKRTVGVGWSRHVVGKVKDGHTRPMLLVDDENGRVYVFAMTDNNGKDEIYMKSADINNPVFPEGVGTPFIVSATDTRINHPTSTKQPLNSNTGLLVLAGDHNSRFYFHNYLDLEAGGDPEIESFSPASGAVGTEVTITGSNFINVTSVNINNVAADGFSLDSDSQVRVNVPNNATTGKIAVVTVGGTAVSLNDFSVLPTISSFTPASGFVATEVTIAGANLGDVNDVKFNGTSASTFIIDSETQIRANVPSGATTGKISVVAAGGAAQSADDFSVIASATSTFDPQHDAYVRLSTPTDNFGGSSTLRARATGTDTLKAFLKFEVTGLSGSVLSAKLRLNVASASVDGGGLYVVSNNFFGISDPWTESELNWDNAPAITGAVLGSAGVASVGQWIEFDVTSVISGNGTYSFGMKNGSSDDVHYHSDEAASNHPELVIQTASAPPPAPAISSFTPTSGVVGESVTITGTNFTGASEVKFNTASATSFTVNSATQITATVPTDATTGAISVTTSNGTATSASSFTVTPPSPPAISSFSPISGVVGASVTITGANFIGASDVKFNTTSVTSFTVNSSTQITATVPAGAITGKISVTAPGGTAQSGPDFTVNSSSPPTISSFTPTSGPVGTAVTITGTNFGDASDVQFNTTSATTFTVNSITQITAAVPSGAATGKISVTNSVGTAVSVADFTVTAGPPAPTIISFTPTGGPVGTVVTITGTNFTGANDVKFNTTSVTSFTVNSATEITATVPAGASSGKISVTTADGTALSANDFIVTGGGSTTLTFFPSHDSWVRQSTPGSNFGADDRVRARNTGTDELRSFFKFNVSGLSGVVVSAKLRLEVINTSDDGGSIYAVSNDHNGTSTPWTETALNWSNAPAIAGSALSTKGVVALNEIVEFDVTSAITGNGTLSFGMKNNSSNDVHYYSKEGLTVPQLVIVREPSPTPIVSSFSPTSALVGEQVTIAGSNFVNINGVQFNGTTASTFTVNSTTQITATVPSGAATGKISVTNDVETGISADDFTVLSPTITSFTPASGVVGTEVTITGANFTGVSAVKFNGLSASTFTVDSATQIRATVPAGATNGKISVTTPSGTGLSENDFGVNPPIITSFSPASGVVGTEVTVNGSNIMGTTNVTFNGIAGFFTVDSPSQVRAIVPAAATSGKIGVSNNSGTGLSADDFLVTPVITSFAPATGSVGMEVTITGSGFNGTSSVKFNGTTAISFTLDSPTQVRATVPTGASTGKISVTTAGGTALSPVDFALSPEIFSFTPASGLVGAEVTIIGTNFTGSNSVKFNGTSASTFTVDSNTQIRANVPGEATTGNISVTSGIGTGLSANNFVVTPAIDSFTPTSGVAGAEVTIAGSGFTGASSVQFNGISASTFTVDSHSQINVIVPVGASTGKISVTTAGGTVQSASDFTLPGPSINSFSPGSGAVGVEITITGTNFNGANSVKFNGFSASTFNVDSNTQIRANVPLGATTGKITVTTLGGTTLSANDFLVIPVISSFSPASGVAGAEVTISGSSFSGATGVQFNGISASTFTVDSNTQVRAIVPASATTGKISLTTPGGTALSSTDFGVSPPSITSFTPASGLTGTEVTITGSNFVGVSSVTFNEISASTFTVDSNTQIRATVPATAATGKISVTTPGGTALSATDFIIPAPMVNSFSPASGLVGAEVTITGSNLVSATDVKFNGASASTFTVDSATQIRVTVPVTATTGKISVTTPGGTGVSAGDFTVGPVIASFTPASAVANTEVTITGSNFTGTTSVQFNSVGALFIVDSATQIRATVPASASTGKISVTTGVGTHLSATDFLVTPVISSFTPANGLAEAQVTITGISLAGTTSVTFNGTSATTFTVNSSTQITATVPIGATTGKISVTTGGGTAMSATNFTILAPNISSFTPTSSLVGVQITIIGSNFTGAASVKFNATSATTFAVNSATQIAATVPTGATTGKISVTTGGGTATSAADFTVIPPAPVISAFTPSIGVIGSEVTIAGNNFSGATNVKFNTTSATAYTVDSATQIRATVPIGATTGKISVTTSGGTAASAADFTPTSSATITEQFTPLYDAYARLSTPTSNYGTTNTLRLRKTSSEDLDSYLKFDVSGINGPVVNAKLRLYVVNDSNDGGSVYAVSNFYKSTSDNWTQSGLNWNNAPVISSSPLSSLGAVALDVWVEYDVTAAIAGNGTFSFGLTNNSSNDAHFSSQEGANKPELLVEYSTGAPLPPSISLFSPTSGLAGASVTITGANFGGASSVKFNGASATTFTVNSVTQITATVPTGATTGKISVTTGGGTATSAADFIVTTSPSAPTIISFTPTSGSVGTGVSITGTNFSGVSSVKFNTTSATTFTVNSATQITATVPTGATTGKISVTTGGGTATSAADFTVTPAGTTTVTILPFHDAYVSLASPTNNYGNSSTLRIRKSSSDQRNAFMKFHVTGISGATIVSAKIRLKVTNDGPDGGTMYEVSNYYLGTTEDWLEDVLAWNNAPAISGAALGSAGTVTVGAVVEFDVTSTITGNGTYSYAITNNSSNDVYYSSSAGADPPELVIQTGTGSGPLPTIASFTPTSGPVGTGVTITGENLSGASSVKFNGTSATTFTVNSATQITATVPTGATTGKISVTTGGGTATSTADFTVGTSPSPPTISSFTPTSGPVGTGVTITGTNFSGASSVKFNTTSATTFTVNSATQITATVPTGATTGKISVTTGGGTVTSGSDFTVTTAGTTTLTINPHEDAYVQLSSPTTNYGSASSLRVRKSSSEQLNSYLKFGISGVTGAVISAKLRLKVTNASNDGGSVHKVSNNYANSSTSWSENGLNWNNAPPISGTPLSSVGAVNSSSFVEFIVTPAITGNGTVSFAIKNNSSDDVHYSSTEGANDPELVIEVSTSSFADQADAQEDVADQALPDKFSLSPNFPNPFNGQTTIEYALPEASTVRLMIYNTLGQAVRRLVDEVQSAGYKRTVWDGRDDFGVNVGSGVYFYQLEAGGHRLNGRMILQQ